MTNKNQSEGLSPKEFFESEWYGDGLKQLCADGWPTFVVPVNIQIRKLISDYDKIKEENKKLQKRVDVFERAKLIWERWNGDRTDLMDASQEAQHYNWLDEQNEKLEEENQNLRDELSFIKQYLNPADTSFRQMIDAFVILPKEKQDKLIDLSRSLVNLSETPSSSNLPEFPDSSI